MYIVQGYKVYNSTRYIVHFAALLCECTLYLSPTTTSTMYTQGTSYIIVHTCRTSILVCTSYEQYFGVHIVELALKCTQQPLLCTRTMYKVQVAATYIVGLPCTMYYVRCTWYIPVVDQSKLQSMLPGACGTCSLQLQYYVGTSTQYTLHREPLHGACASYYVILLCTRYYVLLQGTLNYYVPGTCYMIIYTSYKVLAYIHVYQYIL